MGSVTKADIDAMVEGTTVAREFVDTVAKYRDRTALRWMLPDGSLGSLSFEQVGENAARAAAGLRSLGVRPGDRVVLMMRNIPEFHWLDVGVLLCGATPVSIYNSSSAEQVEYLVGHCGAVVAVVENADFLDKFTQVRASLPDLHTIVTIVDPPDLSDGVVSGAVLTEADPVDLVEAASIGSPEDLATIIYTSGTTGNPKGVMISNYNVCWVLESGLMSYGWTREELQGKRVVSYLPMAHIAERIVSQYSLALAGLEVTTCPETSALLPHLIAVRPNIAFGVPRVWEKLYAGVTAALAADPEKAEKFNEAVAAADPIREKMTWGEASEEEVATYEFLDAVAFSTVRDLVGLDQCEMAITGAAPIPADLIRWFRTIGVPMAEVYGMSENTGAMSFERVEVKPGTVGKAMPGSELAIFPDGEVCCRGGHVFVGYLNDPEKTAEAIDADGWLHSGDIGEIDEDGYLRIIDRKKELIITAGGKNVSPANLEAELKTIPLIGQAAVIGDNRPFVAALLVLDADVAPGWAARHGIQYSSLEELAANPEVQAAIADGVEQAMAGFNNAERVKKWTLLTEEWMPDSDLLTPTFKLKRRGVNETFAAEIEALYA
ncbi:MAG: long-chain fatty acid--CoA ligase [Actinobacteria bacterium]|nr:long-chain fatty acid--CoA ligase [Actinomycetota bacterium]